MMARFPIRPAICAALPLPLRAIDTWPSTPVLGQLLPAQVWLQDTGGRKGATVLWRGHSLLVSNVTDPSGVCYAIRSDARGVVTHVEVVSA